MGNPTPLFHPFYFLDKDAQGSSHGKIHADVFAMREDSNGKDTKRSSRLAEEWIQEIIQLSTGEIWGLGKLLRTHDLTLERPDKLPIDIF